MQTKSNDLLLLAGRIMAILLMALTAVVTIILLVIIPAMFFNQADIAEKVLEHGGTSIGMVMGAVTVILLLAASVTAAACYFFMQLNLLIKSVGQNDPFTLENADRLSRMGWVALMFQLASFPIGALALYLHELVPMEDLTVDYEFELTGLLLAIVLFILARVFRYGVSMREDLEGTV